VTRRSEARNRARLRNGAPPEGACRLVRRLIIPRESGKGFIVRKGQILRVVAIDGQQVCDFNAFNLKNPEEAFWAGGTRSSRGHAFNCGRPALVQTAVDPGHVYDRGGHSEAALEP
jgi:uncharacterized protein YcgI (DUF1989 family)